MGLRGSPPKNDKTAERALSARLAVELEQLKKSKQHDTDLDEEPHRKVEEGEGPWLVSYADMMTLLMGFFALIASFSKPDIKALEEVKKSAVEKFGGQYSEPYKELADKISRDLKKEIQEKKMTLTRSADGVTIVFDGTTFFDSGSFVTKTEGKEMIDKIANSIKTDIPKLKVTVEGHTDNVPIRHPIIASNWELSGIRAARIALVLEEHGFGKPQLTIMGWGETKPLVPNQDNNGADIPQNQARNRRVILKIYKDM